MDAGLQAELAERGLAPDCVDTILVVRDVLARVGDKWTMLIVTALEDGPMRFTTLHRHVPGISQRMLGHTLAALTRDGLATRTAYPEVPPVSSTNSPTSAGPSPPPSITSSDGSSSTRTRSRAVAHGSMLSVESGRPAA